MPFSRRLRAALRPVLCSLALAATTSASVVATTAAPASAATPSSAPHRFTAAIEDFAPYQPQTHCDPVAKKGVLEFRRLILSTYAGTGDDGITRACNIGDRSEHKEGRAWDWAVSINNPRQVRQVKSLFAWLFATDKFGNRDAMVRRLGIMYIIWNKRIWNASYNGGGWAPYSCSGVTGCHRNHVHFSFGWAGALGRTSYWTGKVSPVLPAPAILIPDSKLPKRVNVDPRRAPTDFLTKTAFALHKWHHYRVTVSGAYSTDWAGDAPADAECVPHADGVWRRWVAGGALSALDLSVSGRSTWTPVVDDGHGCSADHTYYLDITPRHDGRLHLVVNDPDRSDDSGALHVTITKRPAA